MSTQPSRIGVDCGGLAEPLEPRLLLAATLDPANGLLSITGEFASNIIQFQVEDTASSTEAPTSFSVLQSGASIAPPPLSFPTRQQILDFIASGGTPTNTSFNISEVRVIDIRIPGPSPDLIILSKGLRIPVQVVAGDGSDSISGGAGQDTLTGEGGTDYIFGGDGNDIVDGGFELVGQASADELLGGGGRDAVDYSRREGPVTVTLDNAANDGAGIMGAEGENIHRDIEALVGSDHDDLIDASGVTTPVFIDARHGDDTIIGGDAGDTLLPGNGADSIAAAGGDDVIRNDLAPDDTVGGGDGLDLSGAEDVTTNVERFFDEPQADPTEVPGGTAEIGDDGIIRVTGTSGPDDLFGQRSSDGLGAFVIERRRNSNTGEVEQTFVTRFDAADVSGLSIDAGGGADFLIASGPAATVLGGDGPDVLIGQSASDRLFGGAGDDWLLGGPSDLLDGGEGGDLLTGGPADYSARTRSLRVMIDLAPNDGEHGEGDNVQQDIDTVFGGSGDDYLDVVVGAAALFGNGGNDTLLGGLADDTFNGGPGRDSMAGGNGVDSYFARDGERDTIVGASSSDFVDADDEDEQ